MSDIPKARSILREAIDGDNAYSSITMYGAIVQALELLDRKKPAFVARPKFKALDDEGKERARQLRAEGKGVNEIARILNTNTGRVSTAVNKKEDA